MAHEVFICYANPDKTVAEAVCSKLEDSGIRCWIAPRDIWAGEEWDKAIMDAIPVCRIVVLVFSATSNDSPYCISEIRTAFDLKKEIIPILIDNTLPHGRIALYLGSKQWLDAQKPPLEQHLIKLVDEVKRHLAQAAAREEAAARAKKEAEEAKKAQEAARVKKEAEEAAREKARQEAEAAEAMKEAEVTAKDKARREAEATRIKKEAEEAAREKERHEAEIAEANRKTEEARKAREAAIQARKEAEEAIKEKEREEEEAARARKKAEKVKKNWTGQLGLYLSS
jgi:DNA polymerase III gamma/tau subunit